MPTPPPLLDAVLSRPKTTLWVIGLLVLGLGALIPRITIDTDPENMLPEDQPARVFHNAVKTDFALSDLIVVGVVNEVHPDGIFNPQSLARVHELTRQIEGIEGVIRQDLLSLAVVDDVAPEGPGTVRFAWLMQEPPTTPEGARQVREAVERNPTFLGTLVSEDYQAAGIYVPIVEKSESHRITTEIEAFLAGFEGDERYFITGLPAAEDTFGVEMFVQMGIAAPLAGLVLFLMMWYFFRSLALITAPMLVALATVIATMGLLIGLGFTVHIMSSMIPIFLMPIAVVDSVHLLSEFADDYPHIGDKRQTLRKVMGALFTPMLYTSLTSAAGFASLAFAPIPPVQVFGSFVAFGILLAFVLTITLIPAYIALLSEERIAKLGRRPGSADESTPLSRGLNRLGPWSLKHAKGIVGVALLVLAFSAVGILQIEINDNPVRWFRSGHPIRVADRVLNEHFGGTYNAYLVVRHEGEAAPRGSAVDEPVRILLEQAATETGTDLRDAWTDIRSIAEDAPDEDYQAALIDAVWYRLDEASDAEAAVWENVLAVLEAAETEGKTFLKPEALAYLEDLQLALLEAGQVGKSTSVADIVKTVHRALREGDDAYFTVPASSGGVAQTLLSYQSSHRPDDLWHFVTPGYDAANIWVQLKSGDNQDMAQVTRSIDAYVAENPPPDGLAVHWGGLTYLNVVWQQEMVNGMLNALLSSFVIVFVMMLLLFRSFWFGLLAMVPLTVTIAFIYGLIGWIGKNYDMPIAVLSSLTLGLSIDFAIHFLQRARATYRETGDWPETVRLMFEEPARAISRNALVIAIGFLPLLLSPLVPYNTVGLFMAAIMIVSSVVTLLLLPGLIHLVRKVLFKPRRRDALERVS